MKTLLSLLFIFSVSLAMAQTRTATFQGREVKVFPYRLENFYILHDNFEEYTYMFNYLSTPFITDKLEDGEYIMYYADQIYYGEFARKGRKNKNKDSLVVAAVFNIKNNQKEGRVCFYSYNNSKKPIATGSYKNDLKDSVWTASDKREKISIEFKEGLIDGRVIRYNFKYKVQSIKVIKNGEEVQQFNPRFEDKEMYQGRKVAICKYRIALGEDGGGQRDSTLLEEPIDILNIKEVLADGEYLVYYKTIVDMDNNRLLKLESKQKSSAIAANFCIKNGKLEGPFYGFEYGKQNINSKNNKRASIITNFKNGQLNGKFYDHAGRWKTISNYIDGELNGQELFYSKRKLSQIRSWKNGKLDGKEEYYENGKLEFMTTWKNGTCQGAYMDKIDKNCIRKGYHLSTGIDSFTEIICKKKSQLIITNSFLPFQEMDTTELDWYIMPTSFPFNNNTGTSLYTKYEEIGRDGKPVSTQYFYKGCRKIPYVLLNARGDTIETANRMSSPSEPYKSSHVLKFYDKKNNLYHIKEYHNNWIKGNQFNTQFSSGPQMSWTTFTPDSIVKYYILNRPVSGWNGWMTKRDSSITIDVKTGHLKIHESFSIKNFGEFRDIDNLNNNSFSTFNNRDVITYSFIPNDTVQTTFTRYLFNKLSYSRIYKKCLKDSSIVSNDGDVHSVNPLSLGSLEIQNLNETYNLTGKDGCILSYEEKPYTGKIIVNEVFSAMGSEFQYEGNLQTKSDAIYITKYIALSLENPKDKIKKAYELRNFEFNYTNGLLNGEQRCWNADGNSIYVLNFKNGVSHGSQNFSLNKTDFVYSTIQRKSTNYDSGLLDGNYTITDTNGNVLLNTYFSKGKLNGPYQEFSPLGYKDKGLKQLVISANFKNDNLDGVLSLYFDGQVIESKTFVDGQATGEYLKIGYMQIDASQSDAAHGFKQYTKFYLERKTKLLNGVVMDTVFGYFPDGGISYIAVMDSAENHYNFNRNIKNEQNEISKYFTYVLGNQKIEDLLWQNGKNIIRSRTGLNLDPMPKNSRGFYTYYYKNGVKAQMGNLSYSSKYCNWKYWSENGVLMKDVYYKGCKEANSSIPYNYMGILTTYYPNGKILMKGYIVSQELSYQCNQELEIAYENVIYTHFYNEQGKDIYNQGNCSVLEFHLNGSKRYNGQISNGQNTGLWKFYDPNGNLSGLGEYVNGKKQGRWLTGDLGGINYIDNACSINEALDMLKDMKSKNIDIIETIYKEGVVISSSRLSIEKY